MTKLIKRAYTRFKPEPGTIAQIDSKGTTGEFEADEIALVYEEAFRGCGLVMVSPERMLVGDRVRVKIGDMPPIAAEVRWRVPLEIHIIKIGLMFLD